MTINEYNDMLKRRALGDIRELEGQRQREVAILLAALRMAQENMAALNAMPQLEGHPEVDAEDIDELCENINTP